MFINLNIPAYIKYKQTTQTYAWHQFQATNSLLPGYIKTGACKKYNYTIKHAIVFT